LIKFYTIFLIVAFTLQAQQFRFLRPVPDTIQTNGSYLYGEPNINNPANAHRGIDIAIRYDTVYSASDGYVDFVGYNPNDTIGGYEPGGGGNYIRIKSMWEGKNVYLYYMHLTKPLVTASNNVITGQPIAISGNTGNSTGPHLHFEIRMNTPDFGTVRSRRNAELWVAISGMGAIYGHIPNALNSTRVDISPDPKPRPPYTTFGWALTYNFNDIYIGSDDVYLENYAIGDVKPGTYTITALNGSYHRVVTVNAGEVVNADPPSDAEEEVFASDIFSLKQNYPNPFNPNTTISYNLSENAFVVLKVFDILGNEISVLVNEEKSDGDYEVHFNASDLPTGVYVYSIIVQSYVNSKIYRMNRKMLFLK
jgi:murein DD-endopeptidase MepM/ murein hydrolase activator NlpD